MHRRPPSVRSQRMLHAISVISAVPQRPLDTPHSSSARARRSRHCIRARSRCCRRTGRAGCTGTHGQDQILVTVNDFHGRIERAAEQRAVSPGSRGAVKQLRAANPNTVFAAAGDMIGASTFTSFIQNDVPTIETLNEAGLDVSAVGQPRVRPGLRRPARSRHGLTAVHPMDVGVHRGERLGHKKRLTRCAPSTG